MTNLSQSFNKMLEQYVFATVDQVINLAEPKQQAVLIKLVIDMPGDANSCTAPQLPVIQSTEIEHGPLPDQSSINRRIHDRWLTDLFQRQMERNQASIAQLEQAIESTRQGFQSRTNAFRNETRHANMAMWHTRVLDQYQRYLVTLQTMQRHNHDQLSRLISY